jgi:protoheme IX farnesyltransferase
MWWDADIDAVMRRTRSRPVPGGRVAAGLLAFTIFFYAVIYTMWLKRLTPQNIVIGGAAGAFPPVIGWAAVTGGVSLEAVLMFGLIFMWTPPHFWALALFIRSDFHDAGVPMLTVTHGREATRRQVWRYALGLTAVVVALGLTPVAGPAFAAAALVLHGLFLRGAWIVRGRGEAEAEADGFAAEKALFKLSLFYVLGLFAALVVDAGLGAL